VGPPTSQRVLDHVGTASDTLLPVMCRTISASVKLPHSPSEQSISLSPSRKETGPAINTGLAGNPNM
jgi:hypothetical protein